MSSYYVQITELNKKNLMSGISALSRIRNGEPQ